jgi:hypothetical protein
VDGSDGHTFERLNELERTASPNNAAAGLLPYFFASRSTMR